MYWLHRILKFGSGIYNGETPVIGNESFGNLRHDFVKGISLFGTRKFDLRAFIARAGNPFLIAEIQS